MKAQPPFLSPHSVRALLAWLNADEIEVGAVFRRVIVRRYTARPKRAAVNLNTISGQATWDMRRFAARDAVAARTENHISELPLHPGSVTPIYRGMIESALKIGAFDDLDKEQAASLISGFSSHSTRVGLNQDLFAVGKIMVALRGLG